MLRIKICGITRPSDARRAAAAGADAIGLVFYPSSPRAVSIDQARRIIDALPPFVTPVGVFVNAMVTDILDTASATGLRAFQLHGGELAENVVQVLRPYRLELIKAWRIGSRADIDVLQAWDRKAGRYVRAYLLDSRSRRGLGGTGETFPWELAASCRLTRPIVLAGGLTADNVAEAVAALRPWGVDVSSGVEKRPGVKDAARIGDFIAAARGPK